jgi:hypothetical protein
MLGIVSAGLRGMLFGYTVTYNLVYRNATTVDGHCTTVPMAAGAYKPLPC